MLEQQLNETRIRKSIEIEEVRTGSLWCLHRETVPLIVLFLILQVDSKVQAVYEEKLALSLKELRDTYENQMAENRYRVTVMYR
jgi:hypothetical protein